jgi:NADH-quinone oxidoreductase subunit J
VVAFLFYFFFAVAIGGAIGVVLSKSPVGSLLFMVTTLFALSAEFVLLEAHFLAAVQIIVYAGAIMVLFLFVIMLLNLGHEYRQDLRIGLASIGWLVAVGVMAGFAALRLGGGEGLNATPTGAAEIQAAMEQYGAVGAIARPLYTTYVVPFEITGILLLVAIVGALVLAKRSV